MQILADTTAVVDLWRNRRSIDRVPDLLGKLGNQPFISQQVVFEFARGGFYKGMTENAIRHYLSRFEIIPTTDSLIYRASEIDGTLRRRGITVGSGDILIAAAALEADIPVLTANVKDFARIPGVVIVEYQILEK